MSKEDKGYVFDEDRVAEFPDSKETTGRIIDELRKEVNAKELDTLRPVIEEHLDYLDSLSNQTEELRELITVAENNYERCEGVGLNYAMSVKFAKHLHRISERLDLIASDIRFIGNNSDPSELALNCSNPGVHSGIENGGQQFEPEED